ncbi:potassium channel family protein [Xanthomarina spongicola]|uniref:Ion channel n=1 Tax=Xanthomarina spongicola TaxID=570520 RepID=A0A316DKB2_9FLAO|nr:potassium channel family protein [Xanthomarina spongicola]PWK17942.1 ion channel [Xanthomarina spongicola]
MNFERLYTYRFELFFFSLIAILFGSLLFPKVLFAEIISHILFLVNISSGYVIFSKRRKQSKISILLFFLALSVFLYRFVGNNTNTTIDYIKVSIYFIFYTLITFEIIRQVWQAKEVNKKVIFGLMSGYVSIGLLGFFVFFSIELAAPNSFNGLVEGATITNNIDSLIYYSYITLMTIGYGDITPISDIAQKATMFFAMMGQFYMVIVTAVVVEKYIRHSHLKE